MAKLPSDIKPKKVITVLGKFGFRRYRGKGSHVHLKHPSGKWTQVAVHPKPVPAGTLRKILRQADITVEDFLEQL